MKKKKNGNKRISIRNGNDFLKKLWTGNNIGAWDRMIGEALKINSTLTELNLESD